MNSDALEVTADRMLADAKGEYQHPRQTVSHAEWCRRYRILSDAAQRVHAAKRARALAMLRSVGMSDGKSLDMCCIHNCSISTIGNGWGWHEQGEAAARLRRRVCQQVKELLNDYAADVIVTQWARRVQAS